MPFDTRIPLMAGQGVQAIDVDPQKAVTALYQAEAARALAQNRQAQAQMRMQQAAEEAALNAAMQSTGGNPMEAAKILTSGGHASAAQKVMEDHDKRVKGFYETSKAQMEVAGLESKWLADVARTMRGGPAGYAWGYSLLGRAKPDVLKQAGLPDPDQYDGRPLPVLQEWEQFGVSAQERAKAAIDAMGAIQKTPDSLAAAWRALATAEDEDDVQGIRTMLMMHPEAESILQVLPSHFDPRLPEIAKQKIAQLEKQTAAGAAPQVGTPARFIIDKYGANATPEQQLQGLKEFEESKPDKNQAQFIPPLEARPSREDSVKPMEGTFLTKGGVWEGSGIYGLKGVFPVWGRATGPMVAQTNSAIMNTATERAARIGVSLPTLQAEYSAKRKELDKLVPSYGFKKYYAQQAMLGIENASKVGFEVRGTTGVPLANVVKNWIESNLTGDPKLAAYEVWVMNVSRDWAKATLGGEASIQQLTDAAAGKADQLLNTKMTGEQRDAVLASMRQDMINNVDSLRREIGEASYLVQQFLDEGEAAPTTPDDYATRLTGPSLASGRAVGEKPPAQTFVATKPNGEKVYFRSAADRDSAVRDSAGQLTVEGGTTPPQNKPGVLTKTTKHGTFESTDGGLNWTKVGG